MKHPRDLPDVCRVAPCAPGWQPRSAYSGSFDEVWRKNRMPAFPKDFDMRFFHVATPELCFPEGKYEGGERLTMRGLTQAYELSIELPICELVVEIRLAGTVIRKQPLVELVTLLPNEHLFSLLYKTTLRCERKASHIEKATVDFASAFR